MKNKTPSDESSLLRKKAEEQLRNGPVKSRTRLTEAETLKLIHDLEVHQIELEMLNDELVLAKEQADAYAGKYADLYNFAPSGYFTLTRDGKILEINLTGAKMLGRERSRLINASFTFFITDVTKPAVNLFLDQAFGSKDKQSCEAVIAIDGNLPLHVHLTGIADETAKQCFVTLLDISERKNAEEAIKLSNDRYQLLSEHMTDVVFMLDMDFRVTYQSPSSEKLRGFTTGELRNLPMDKSMTAESLRLALGMFSREIPMIRMDPLYNPIPFMELEYYKKDGTTCWLENRFSIIRNSNGLPVSILGEGRDITERRRMEQALKENKTRELAFLTAIPDLIFMLNRQGVYLFYKAATEDLAFQTDSIIGKRNRDMTSPEFADLIDEKINLAFEQNQIQAFEYELQLPGRGIRKFEARMVPSGPDEVVAIVRDVTEQKNAETEIKLKNELLIKLNAEKDKFFSIIAHDLRSPFNAFLGFTQMLSEDLEGLTFKEIHHIVESMRKSASNLFQLLENLLEWSRLQRGISMLNPQSFLLLPKIEEVMLPVREAANKKMIEVAMNIPEDLMIYADTNMLGSSIRNLAFNAVKFTTRGGQVTISAKTLVNNHVEISVCDTGIGMNKTILDNLFRIDVNVSRKGTKDEPSTGLGLILCKEFIEKHGGKIRVESEVGKGSTFIFTMGGESDTGDN